MSTCFTSCTSSGSQHSRLRSRSSAAPCSSLHSHYLSIRSFRSRGRFPMVHMLHSSDRQAPPALHTRDMDSDDLSPHGQSPVPTQPRSPAATLNRSHHSPAATLDRSHRSPAATLNCSHAQPQPRSPAATLDRSHCSPAAMLDCSHTHYNR